MTPSPIVECNPANTAIVIRGFSTCRDNDLYLPVESARQFAADLIRAADRIDAMPVLSPSRPVPSRPGSTTRR
jgi:hypothetical protein